MVRRVCKGERCVSPVPPWLWRGPCSAISCYFYDSESDLENSTAPPNIPTCVKSKYSALQQTRESGSSLITPMSVPFCMKSCLVPFCVVFLLSKLHIQSCHLLCFSYTREDPDDLQMLLLITSQGQRGFRFWLFCAFVGRRGADDAC